MRHAHHLEAGLFGAKRSSGAHHSEPSAAKQFLEFCLVGLSNAIVDLGVLNALLLLRPTRSITILVIYNTIAVSLAIINSYLWNTRWTFRGHVTKEHRQRVLFIAQALLNMLLNNLIIVAMTTLLAPSGGASSLIINNVAKLVAMAVASSTSFYLLRTIVFRSHTNQHSAGK